MPSTDATQTQPPHTHEKFIVGLRQAIIQFGLSWHEPTVAQVDTEDTVEISWWRADKSLIVTVDLDSPISYLQGWGPNIHSEMASGENPTTNQLITLWQWLNA